MYTDSKIPEAWLVSIDRTSKGKERERERQADRQTEGEDFVDFLGFRKSKQLEEICFGRVSIIDIPLEAAETQVFLLSPLYIVLSVLYQSISDVKHAVSLASRCTLLPHGR